MQVSPSSAFITTLQVPFDAARAHERQESPQETLQQKPSVQNVEAHSVTPPHPLPLFSLQAAMASQVLVPDGQESGSSRPFTAVQVPSRVESPGVLHAKQGSAQAVLQQTPSAQLPERHSVPFPQAIPFLNLQVPVASHELVAAVQLSGSSAFLTGLHVPNAPACPHVWQYPLQAPSQQYPSAQKADAQSPGPTQPLPFLSLHAPAVSQVLVAAGQVSGSSAFLTIVQVPALPVSEHEEQVSVHAEPQQIPSGQKPDAHADGEEQAWAFFSLHAPAALHVLLAAGQVSGSSAALTELQIPLLADCVHEKHAPVQDVSQQRPSTQRPEAHAVPEEQVVPFAARHAPAAEQALVPSHVPGSGPAGTTEQDPRLPGAAHVRHVPAHAPSQQTSSAQNPDVHSLGRRQPAPSGRSAPVSCGASGGASTRSAPPRRRRPGERPPQRGRR